MLELRSALPGDTWLILPTVRQADIDELAALGVTPESCLRQGIQLSDEAVMVTIHGEPAGVVGTIETQGCRLVWGVFTTQIDRHPIPFLRACRRWLADKGPLLNYCDARNVQTITWLSWLGFHVEHPEPYGLNGEPFHRFWRL